MDGPKNSELTPYHDRHLITNKPPHRIKKKALLFEITIIMCLIDLQRSSPISFDILAQTFYQDTHRFENEPWVLKKYNSVSIKKWAHVPPDKLSQDEILTNALKHRSIRQASLETGRCTRRSHVVSCFLKGA